MARIVPAPDVGLPPGAGRVRVSTSRARRGKILAVEHPIFGWIPYRQWALLRLIPEERIVPAIVGGIATYYVLRVSMETAGKVASVAFEFPFRLFLQPGGILLEAIRFFLPSPVPVPTEEQLSDLWNRTPIPFYGGLLVASFIIAGVDPGEALIALTNLIGAIIPG